MLSFYTSKMPNTHALQIDTYLKKEKKLIAKYSTKKWPPGDKE